MYLASSASEGFEVIHANMDIPVVISDMKMPLMSGLEFIRKAKEAYPEKVYFILTAFDITNDIQDALTQGLIRSHFRKPIDIQEIDTAVRNAVQSSGQRRLD